MFTGIISDVGQIIDITPSGKLSWLKIASAYDAKTIALGALSQIPAHASPWLASSHAGKVRSSRSMSAPRRLR